MRINITINDETIMNDIQYAIEEEEYIFESEEEKADFEAECFETIAYKTEFYEDYLPTWDKILDAVMDLASERGIGYEN